MAAEAGLDWLDIVVGVVGIAGGLTAGARLFLHVTAKVDRLERNIAHDPDYRVELADRLENPGLATAYRDRLKRSLAWLDRRFGQADSGEALGTCVVIALCYAWVAFFLGYAITDSGNLGDFDLLPTIPSAGVRWAVFAFTCLFPPLAFLFGRRMSRLERLWKTRFRRRRRIRSKRRFERRYRIVAALAMGLAILGVGLSSNAGVVIVFQLLFFIGPIVLGPAVAVFVAHRVRMRHMWRQLVAFAVSMAAGAGAGAGALAVPPAIATAGVEAIVVVIAVAGALLVAVPVTGTVAGTIAGTVAGAVAIIAVGAVGVTVAATGVGSGAVVVAVAVAGGIAVVVATAAGLGTVMALKHHQGAIAGAIAGVVVFALLIVIATDKHDVVRPQFVAFFLLFFLVLPLANGFWDWLSWWATRWLGERLLGRMDRVEHTDRPWRAILGHGLLDLAIAVGLLTSMAFTMALGFELFSQIWLARTGQGTNELLPFLINSAAEPFGKGLWLSVMLLSTLLPTVLHLLLLTASPFGFRAFPGSRRQDLVQELRAYDIISNQASIRRRAANYVSRDRYVSLMPATVLTALLIVVSVVMIDFALSKTAGVPTTMATLVLYCAEAGIHSAQYLASWL